LFEKWSPLYTMRHDNEKEDITLKPTLNRLKFLEVL
jgi:hypothetical protein